MSRKWTELMVATLKRKYYCTSLDNLAQILGVTQLAVKCKAIKLGLFRRKRCTAEQVESVRQHYGKMPTSELATLIGRSEKSVYLIAMNLGLTRPRFRPSDELLDRIRCLSGQGLTDEEIGREVNLKRRTVCHFRRKLGLPSQIYGERHRQHIRESTQRQLDRAGLANLGEVRREAYRQFARESGWPEDLRPRHVQILNLLAARGVPLCRRQIVEGIGLEWKHPVRLNDHSNDPEGSHLAHLAARGLVQVLKRAHQVLGHGKGRFGHLYCLGPVALEILAHRAQEESCTESSA